jgi:hypothetical protein
MLMQISISPAQALWIDFMEMEKILRGIPREERAGLGGACPVSVGSVLCNGMDALYMMHIAFYIVHLSCGVGPI